MGIQKFQDFLEEHKLECFLTSAALIATLLNMGEVRSYMAANTQLRQSVAATQVEINQQLANAASREQLKDLANLRYDGYCEPVFNLNKDGVYTALTPGSPVIKGDSVEYYRQNPDARLAQDRVLPAGTPVCDAYGNTALIEDSEELPVIGAIASTNDSARIKNFIDVNGGRKELSAL